nr:unnamed protein product [Digitaria exilis]
MLLLRRRLLPLFRLASSIPSPIHHGALAPLSTSASASPPPSAPPFSVGDHLVDASGLAGTPTRSCSTVKKKGPKDSNTKAFKDLSLPRLNSASNSNPVALFSSFGLSRADIDAVVAADPRLLSSSAEDIAPHLIQLRDRYGLSAAQIFRFLLSGSPALRCGDLDPRLEFFVSFFGSIERLLVVMKKNNKG